MLPTAGCTDYLARRDSLGFGAGNAVQTNLAVHVIDPWPRNAQSTNATTNGERLARAVERYRNPQTNSAAAGQTAATPGAGFGSGGALAPGSVPTR